MPPLEIGEDHPSTPDVASVIERHRTLMYATTPPEHVFALDGAALAADDVTLVVARRDGAVVGIGALKQLDAEHGELKSMHTVAEARGQGVGDAVLAHLLGLARARGYRRVSLETGVEEAFAAARRLYERVGFTECGPFADYAASEVNTFMTMVLPPSSP